MKKGNDNFVFLMQKNLGKSHFCRQVGYLHVPYHMLSGVLTMLGFPQSKLINQAKGAAKED